MASIFSHFNLNKVLIIAYILRKWCGITLTLSYHLIFWLLSYRDIFMVPRLWHKTPTIALTYIGIWGSILVLMFKLRLFYLWWNPLVNFNIIIVNEGKINMFVILVDSGVAIIKPRPLFNIKVVVQITHHKNKIKYWEKMGKKILQLVWVLASQGQWSGRARGGPMVLGSFGVYRSQDVKLDKTINYILTY